MEGATKGRVNYVVVRPSGGRLGVVASLFGEPGDVIVPLLAMHLSGQGDAVRLDASPEKLRDAPRFRAADVRRLHDDPALARAIAVYYGVDAAAPAQAAASSQAPATPAPASVASAASAAPPAGAPTGPAAQTGVAAPAAAPPAAAPAQQADAAHGKAVANRVCSACHSLAQGGPVRVEPPLWGVDGRQVASVQGFSYSAGLRNRGGTWDDTSLDAFLKNPRGYAPGARMACPGIQNNRDRADVVAFLNQLRQGPMPMAEPPASCFSRRGFLVSTAATPLAGLVGQAQAQAQPAPPQQPAAAAAPPAGPEHAAPATEQGAHLSQQPRGRHAHGPGRPADPAG